MKARVALNSPHPACTEARHKPEQHQTQAEAVESHEEAAMVEKQQRGGSERRRAWIDCPNQQLDGGGRTDHVQGNQQLFRDQRWKNRRESPQQQVGRPVGELLAADGKDFIVPRPGIMEIARMTALYTCEIPSCVGTRGKNHTGIR